MEGYRVLNGALRNSSRAGRQPLLHRVNGPGERGGVGAVDLHRVEAVQPQMLVEPFSAPLLLHGAALFDAATVEDHERCHEAAVFCPPPARRPVTATLLLESAVAEEHHQPLAGQGHVHVLQFGKAEIAALGQTACRIRADVAAQRRGGTPLCVDRVAIEIPGKAREAAFAAVVSLGVARRHVAHQKVAGIDARDAMALAHQPATRQPTERVRGQVADIGRHDVQRPTGMPLRRLLEILGSHLPAIGIDPVGIGHVNRQPHACHGQAVRRPERAIHRGCVARLAFGNQHLCEIVDSQLREIVVGDGAVAARPAGELGIRLAEHADALGDPGKLVVHVESP